MSSACFKVAYSPCPNDTFLFGPWVLGLLPTPPPIEWTHLDIQSLNEEAERATFPYLKCSCASFSNVVDKYQFLPVGSAFGYQAGPILVARDKIEIARIPELCLATPGPGTSAVYLFNHLFPSPRELLHCLYSEVKNAVLEGWADIGLMIHEERFTIHEHGLHAIVDLGVLWNEQKKVPVPLGCLLARRDQSPAAISTFIASLRSSLDLAWKEPLQLLSYIQEWSQDRDPDRVLQFINTYVTSETRELSAQGKAAIETFLPSLPDDWLFEECSSPC